MEKKNAPILGRRIFLYLTSFFSGMSVMAIELGASRLLAPYFSSSQIVWTVIIGTIMIAMAIGNVWGGRSADRHPEPERLFRRLLLVAVWTALIPFIGRWVIAGVTGLLALFISSNFLVWASMGSCLVLFVFPLMLLGTVTPSLMKYTTDSLDDNGKTLGELEALNTIGSIIGTFLPTFVTIPAVGTARTFLIFAAILAVISLAFFVSQRRWIARSAVCAVIITALVFAPANYSFAFWEGGDVVLEDESIYNYLQVKEDDRRIALSTNVAFGVQSIKIKDGGMTGMYYDYALAAPLMAEKAEDVLILGLGTGTFAELCLERFPGCEVTGVEIDEKIVDISREYFGLPEEVNAIVGDGRAWLTASEEKWDVIMVDAYQDITIPFQMSSVEFFTEVREHLAPGGVMVVNMSMRSESAGSMNEYLMDTIQSVFPYCGAVRVANGTNMELFASAGPEAFERFEAALEALPAGDLRDIMERVDGDMFAVEGGEYILTDDKAPVELLGMAVLDEIIGSELEGLRERIADEGIMSLLGEL